MYYLAPNRVTLGMFKTSEALFRCHEYQDL